MLQLSQGAHVLGHVAHVHADKCSSHVVPSPGPCPVDGPVPSCWRCRCYDRPTPYVLAGSVMHIKERCIVPIAVKFTVLTKPGVRTLSLFDFVMETNIINIINNKVKDGTDTQEDSDKTTKSCDGFITIIHTWTASLYGSWVSAEPRGDRCGYLHSSQLTVVPTGPVKHASNHV